MFEKYTENIINISNFFRKLAKFLKILIEIKN